jgi:hypothetical protein
VSEEVIGNSNTMVPGLVSEFNHRSNGPKRATPTRRFKKADPKPPVDLDKMYQRPQPDVFTREWNDGYNAGFDGDPFKLVNMDWTDGFRTGQIAVVEDKIEMDRNGSSNT